MPGSDAPRHDRRLIATTARLVEFLRDLVAIGQRRIRDVGEYEQAYWLADLPGQIEVDAEAGPGDVLLTVDAVPADPPPDVPAVLAEWLDLRAAADPEGDAPALSPGAPAAETDAYEGWLPHWWSWAGRERGRLDHRRWHQGLRAVADRLSQQDDEFELVLGTGLLTWTSPDGVKVRDHLLAAPLRVQVDAGTERVDVVLGERVAALQDRELLDALDGFLPRRLDEIRERVRSGEVVGLPATADDVLRPWCERALEHGAVFHDTWVPEQAGPGAEVRLAPALVLRKRDRASMIAYYRRMLDALSGPEAAVPLGLAQLVTAFEADERMEFLREQGAISGEAIGADPLLPLPANPEQRQIMARLIGDNGVVVQGPPGTGKTHTIANLVAGLLAEGQRVLVTSQKAQALRVLRDKLPPQIAQLCVSVTDQARGGSAELEGSVKAISSEFSTYDPRRHEQLLTRREDERAAATRKVSTLTEEIRALRESETYQHDEIAPGYRGTLADLARRIKEHEADCSWMPTPMLEGCADHPPLDASEAAELLRLLAAQTPGRAARTSQLLPEPADLPSVERVRELVTAERAAQETARTSANDLSGRLGECDAALLAELERLVKAVTDALHRLGLAADPDGWDAGDWAVRAFRDGLSGQELGVWQQLGAYAGRMAQAEEAAGRAGFREVVVPPAGRSALEVIRRLRDFLGSGGTLKRGPFRSAPQKQAEPFLAEIQVDGVTPDNVELLDIVIDELEARAICDELARGWRLVGVTFPEDQPTRLTVSRLADAHRRLALVQEALRAVAATAETLIRAGIRIPLSTPAAWRDYAASLSAVRLRIAAEGATRNLLELKGWFDLVVGKGHAPPELAGAATAVAQREVAGYERCLAALAAAHRERDEQARCDLLRGRLDAAHPVLATLMVETCADEVWRSRIGVWEQAWAWGMAAGFFAAQRRPGLELRLEAELADATRRKLVRTAELAATKAWGACLSRMTAHQAQALRQYQDHMSKLGKGTGRYAPRYRARAQEAMREAIGAVPAWIMPLRQVIDTIPADRDSFDVVIVDEASQAGIEALFLLWLAPRVIVVGDDKQCAPSVVSHGELEPIFGRLSAYLPDLPAYLRDAFTPKSSLFDLLKTRFGSVIRLKEHFRCMPEIIDYSSRQFYADEPLVPLRQFGADRLDPLRVVRVHGAVTEGTATRLRNEAEAQAIVERILACIADPAYRGRTFGVVVLQGSGQVRLIHSKLLERIDPKEWDERKLRVGSPADFQGDERSVIFLSMVVAERRTAVTSTEWQRRFNVAASRAEDQLWLFHSTSLDLLSPIDLRRSLLAYMLNPPPPMAGKTPDDVSPDLPHPDFDSLFEQRVYLRLRERGYHVVPQFEVNGRRIDLVVSGAKGRLAVECDGDFWHATPEQVEQDLDRERELKRAGWRFWRVRESEYYVDPDAALEPLWKTLHEYGIDPGEPPGTPSAESTWSALTLTEVDGWDGLEDGDAADLDDIALPPAPHSA